MIRDFDQLDPSEPKIVLGIAKFKIAFGNVS